MGLYVTGKWHLALTRSLAICTSLLSPITCAPPPLRSDPLTHDSLRLCQCPSCVYYRFRLGRSFRLRRTRVCCGCGCVTQLLLHFPIPSLFDACCVRRCGSNRSGESGRGHPSGALDAQHAEREDGASVRAAAGRRRPPAPASAGPLQQSSTPDRSRSCRRRRCRRSPTVRQSTRREAARAPAAPVAPAPLPAVTGRQRQPQQPALLLYTYCLLP